jgi:aminoglycoside phosphotransferase (APT) family kinase protein
VIDAASRLGEAIPPTVVHEEATDGNIFVRDGRVRFLDWAEACVSHPFAGSVLALRSAADRAGFDPGSAEVERLRDAYLEPFTRFAPLSELRQAFAYGYLLGALCRALSWHRLLSPLDPAVTAELNDPVAAWLEILRDMADGKTRLGGA